MFEWLKNSRKGKKGPSDGQESPSLDLLEVLRSELESRGHAVVESAGSLGIAGTAYRFQPRLITIQNAGSGWVQTTTTTDVWHPEFFPDRVFEYQHAVGAGTEESLRMGFSQWAEIDLPVLLDVPRDKPEACMVVEFSRKSSVPGEADRKRRVLLGPVSYLSESDQDEADEESTGHAPFCACCMFTNTHEAFREYLDSDELFTVRYFGTRKVESKADCRINGLDYDTGRDAILKYVDRWPDRGFEFRKQFAVFHTVEARE